MTIRRVEDKDGKLLLEFENGDKEKFLQIMSDWNFVDEQSFLRFAMSAMILTTDKTLTITTENGNEKIAPKDSSLKNQ